MKTALMKQVTTAIFEVMETMFFMTLEEVKKPVRIPKNRVAAAISFSGKISGAIFLEIPAPLLETMTQNFMGQDMDDLSPEYTDGTLKEALNMIAGSALTKVDPEDYMGLGIPEIIPSPDRSAVDETVILTTSQDIMLAHVKLG